MPPPQAVMKIARQSNLPPLHDTSTALQSRKTFQKKPTQTICIAKVPELKSK
jgi:hypothetical protein